MPVPLCFAALRRFHVRFLLLWDMGALLWAPACRLYPMNERAVRLISKTNFLPNCNDLQIIQLTQKNCASAATTDEWCVLK